ncbi:AB hydrolase-1 domain-containing protein, partial [Psidium guajava]
RQRASSLQRHLTDGCASPLPGQARNQAPLTSATAWSCSAGPPRCTTPTSPTCSSCTAAK